MLEIERTQDVLSWDVKSDKAGGILEDFHNERWTDGWNFLGGSKRSCETPSSRAVHILLLDGWDGMEACAAWLT